MFTTIKNTKVYEQIIEQIKEKVHDGSLKKGEKLPTEREMAETLQVSRASVREALRALEVVGLIESRQGAGNYIKESFENSLFEPLSIMFMLQESSSTEIYELREVLELETTVLAATKINDEELEILKTLIEELRLSENEEYNVYVDKRFHYTIAKASRNNLILNMLQVISQLIDEFIKDSRKNILANNENKNKLIKFHESIYNALKNGDEKEAYNSMKMHFSLIKESMKEFVK